MREMGGNRSRRAAPMPARIAQHATDNARYATRSMQQTRAGRDGVGGRKRESRKARAPVEPEVDVVEAEPVGRDAAAGRSVAESSHARLPLPPLRALHCAGSRGPRLARGLVPVQMWQGASPVPVKMWILPGQYFPATQSRCGCGRAEGGGVPRPSSPSDTKSSSRTLPASPTGRAHSSHSSSTRTLPPRLFSQRIAQAQTAGPRLILRCAALLSLSNAKPTPKRGRTVPTRFAEVDPADVRHCLPCHIRPSGNSSTPRSSCAATGHSGGIPPGGGGLHALLGLRRRDACGRCRG